MAAGDVEHIGRLAQARQPSAHRLHQRLACRDGRAQVGGAGGEVGMVQGVGLDPRLDHRPHQGAERGGVVVDPAQQHGLAQHRDAGVDDAGAGGAGLGGQLTRVVGVQGDIDRLARTSQRRHQVVGHGLRIDRRDAGVEAHHLHMLDRAEATHQVGEAARRQHQGVAAGDDHLPDPRPGGYVGEGGVEGGGGKRLQPLRAYHLAAEAEAAVDCAGVGDLQQHPVGIAVDDPLDRAMGRIPDGIGVLDGVGVKFGGLRHELARDGVVVSGRLDQLGHGGGDRHGVQQGAGAAQGRGLVHGPGE